MRRHRDSKWVGRRVLEMNDYYVNVIGGEGSYKILIQSINEPIKRACFTMDLKLCGTNVPDKEWHRMRAILSKNTDTLKDKARCIKIC